MNDFDSTIAARVEKGALLLDEARPGWYRDVNRITLDQASVDDCVLGQLFGNYYDGVRAVLGTFTNTTDHGFCSHEESDYPALSRQWALVIYNRRHRARTEANQAPVAPAVPAFSDQALIAAARISTVDLLLMVMGRPESDRALIESAVVR